MIDVSQFKADVIKILIKEYGMPAVYAEQCFNEWKDFSTRSTDPIAFAEMIEFYKRK